MIPAILALQSRPVITKHFFGGVAERFNALVLKTSRVKALVSSNLTPSAFFVFLLHFLLLSVVASKK